MITNIPDTFKCVSVRFLANPELSRGAAETDEMCQRTIGVLEQLRDRRPLLVLMPDLQNRDPHAVLVFAMGRAVAHVERDVAPVLRGMMKAVPSGKLITRITDVIVSSHGFFHVQMPKVKGHYEPEEIGVDWSMWKCDVPLMLPAGSFMEEDSLNMVIREVLLPNLAGSDTEELREYFANWMGSIRYNHSREVALALQEYIAVLSADEREEMRLIAKDMDHLRTQKGTPEVISDMVDQWWEPMLVSPFVCDSFAMVRQRAMSEKHHLLGILDYVEQLMRPMPGDLYNDVGDARQFFSHLYYLAPPLQALQGVLSLMAIRTLICRELEMPLVPFFGSRVPEITDVRLLPTTLGRVMYFDEHLCRTYEEQVTMQRLVDWLERDCRGTRIAEAEAMLDSHNPAPNICINTLVGSATGEVKQEFKDEPKLLN